MDCFARDQKHLLHAQLRTAAEAIASSTMRKSVCWSPMVSAVSRLDPQLEGLPDPPEPWQLRIFDREESVTSSACTSKVSGGSPERRAAGSPREVLHW